MALSQTNELIYNTKLKPNPTTFSDCSNGKYESFHLERDGNGIKIVSDGISDRVAEVQSHKNEAGLVNILKMQELRYGSVENAIIRNKETQTFADVSKIPTNVGEQAAYVAEARAAVDELCSKLGISKEELLSKDAAGIASLYENKSQEGGQE